MLSTTATATTRGSSRRTRRRPGGPALTRRPGRRPWGTRCRSEHVGSCAGDHPTDLVPVLLDPAAGIGPATGEHPVYGLVFVRQVTVALITGLDPFEDYSSA